MTVKRIDRETDDPPASARMKEEEKTSYFPKREETNIERKIFFS